MRADDHQLLMPCYAATFTKGVKYDAEKTGFGWKTDQDRQRQGPDLADHLQDEAAGVLDPARSRDRSTWRSCSSPC